MSRKKIAIDGSEKSVISGAEIPTRVSTLGRQDRSQRISFGSGDFRGSYFKVRLYRFMADAIPLVHSVLWTWTRLAAAPGKFHYMLSDGEGNDSAAESVLTNLFRRIFKSNFGSFGNAEEILVPFFNSLFLDGAIAGRIELNPDFTGIRDFRFFDLSHCDTEVHGDGTISIIRQDGSGERRFRGDDIFFYAHNSDIVNPYGKSILQAVPFVSHIEQQLVDDMRRSMHNAGYHRLHVKIAPPARREDENDEAYVGRANHYFDDTVAMIRDIKTEDNPITWDDVSIDYIGPMNQGGARTSNWYLNHRAMVEEICSGTNLAPFLLGYSYNATTNWAQLKYDLIMRQVNSVQHAARTFLNWLANIELALRGFSVKAEWRFDNRFSALAKEQTQIKNEESSRIIDLFNAGLIDRDVAIEKARELV